MKQAEKRKKLEDGGLGIPTVSRNHHHTPQAKKPVSATLQAKFRQAFVLHQQGRFAEAERAYQEILQQEPTYFDALHQLGVVALQTRRTRRGVELIAKAIGFNPNVAAAHNSLAYGLRGLKRPQEAIASYDKAIALKPGYAEAYNNRGNALNDLKRHAEALASYDNAIALKPNLAEAHNNRGNALNDLKRHEEALASYDKAIALKPGYADAYNNRGNALNALQRHEEALASYERAIALKPGYADAYNNRGNALNDLKCAQEAIASHDRAIALKPDFAEAYSNRGNALRNLQRDEEALANYDKAIALKPNYAEAHNNRGNALNALQRHEEALASYDKAIGLKPDYAEAYFGKSVLLLLMERFEEGWRLYEWRKKVKLVAARSYSQPPWSGVEGIAGKTLFVHWEQGLGDTIQFCRYAKLAEARGAKVIMSVLDSLMWLVKQLSPTIDVINAKSEPSHFDYHIPLLSMPLAFNTTREDIPAEVRYLRADKERVVNWQQKLGNDGIKIGICWQGRTGDVDIGRSFPVTEFCNISKNPNVRLISLQKGQGIEQLAQLPEGMKVANFSEELDAGAHAFLDTAAIMENLDLIITSDTAIAHLAGALGRPTWVALKQVPEWRWGLEGSVTPWYPTLRLFRQKTRGDWKGVFAEIEKELSLLIASKTGPLSRKARTLQTPTVPVSWGELIDKITILEIKTKTMKSTTALKNVEKELAYLLEMANRELLENPALASLKQDLTGVNNELWVVEDNIREKERARQFDSEFIELARSIYRLNDTRAALKKRINIELSSEIIDEKSYQEY